MVVVHREPEDFDPPMTLIQSVNSTVSSRDDSRMFSGPFKTGEKHNDQPLAVTSILQLLEKHGYSEDPHSKRPSSIIILNLISPVINYESHGKAQIDSEYFNDDIAKIINQTCKGKNKPKNPNNPDDKKAREVFKTFLDKRLFDVRLNPELQNTDRWNTSTPVYQVRPILEKMGINVNRKYLQGLVKSICVDELGLKRQQLRDI